jgi:hypothetical protein
VRVGSDTTGFSSGLTKVDSQLQDTGASAGKFGGLMAGAGLLAAGAVTGIVAFGIAAVAKTEEAGQAAYEMGEKFGLAGGQASAWVAVGKQLGVGSDQIGSGFQKLSKSSEALALTLQAGGKLTAAQLQPYKDLGINVLDAGGKVKDSNELMLEAADGFAKMQDGPEKAALAMKLFGKSGTDLLPVLNEGRAGIEGLIASGKAQGDVMTNDQVAAAHKLFLEHKQLDTAIAGVTTQIGTALMPIAIAAIPIVLGFATQVGNTHAIITKLQPWFPLLAGGLTILGGVMAAVLIPMFVAWTIATWAQVTALIAQGIALIAATWPILLIIIAIGLLVAAVVLVMQHHDMLKAKALQIWGDIQAGVHIAINDIVGGFNSMVGFIRGLPGNIASAAAGMWDGIWNAFRGMLNHIVGAWNQLHFTIGGGSFAGVSIPSMTLGVPMLPTFDQGGIVPGAPGSRQIIAALGGEHFGGAQSIGRGGDIHIHIDQGAYIDGPSVDRLANLIVQRIRFAPGT